MAMSMTRAIRESAGHVSIHGRGTSWIVIGPWRDDEPHGPSTESGADSYAKARLKATAWRARVALGLMGRLTEDSAWAVEVAAHDPYGPRDVRGLVAAGLQS